MKRGAMFREQAAPAGVISKTNDLPADWTSPWRFMTVRSLLSVVLIGSSALFSPVEAGPRSFGPETGSLLAPAAPLGRDDLLAQRAGLPPGERQREPDARLPRAEGRRNPIVAGLLSAAVP